MSPSEEFGKLIADGKINFLDADISELPEYGQELVAGFLADAGIKWKLGDVRVGNAICLKLSDDYLQYLDIYLDSGEFLWSTDDHRHFVHSDAASIYLISKKMPDVDFRTVRTDDGAVRTTARFPDGREIEIFQ